jgi:exopolysaccharide biosynthesis protein
MRDFIIVGLCILLLTTVAMLFHVLDVNKQQACTINKMIEVETTFGQMLIKNGVATPEQLTEYIISVRDRPDDD